MGNGKTPLWIVTPLKHSSGYNDNFFGSAWKVFTSNSPIELISLDGKRVCFRDITFSLLARQRQGGLYYNMPLVYVLNLIKVTINSG